ncbi:hypothetical protein [Flavobacterium sp. 102]|uniref:hypothetical protein n=1 Tax=Flavobacterium sp. 102 TaxID=2135623 RepID=UPI000EB48466|nr:hypothetical protein [Flavobacterium sp. 102]RKS02794.1 hypothetical protein C8C84_2523 [Flavobacterium sp. 102]
MPKEKKTKDLKELDEKTALEIKKLNAEIKHLNNSYFYRIIFPILVPTTISALVTVSSIFVLYKSIVSNENEKRMLNLNVSNENTLKNNKLVLEAIELTKQKDELRKSIAEDEKKQKQISVTVQKLNEDILTKNKENNRLKSLTEGYASQLKTFPDELSKKGLSKYLEVIDFQTDFYYSKNPKIYSRFGEDIQKAPKNIYNEVIESYIIDKKNLFPNRAFVLMTAYNNTSNKEHLLNIYHELLNPEICSSDRNKEFVKIVNCKEWSDEVFHKTIVYILKNSLSCQASTCNLLTGILNRNDTKLSIDEDYDSFLLYLSLYQQSIIKKKTNISLSSINQIMNLKNLPLYIIRTYMSAYIISNEESFESFLAQQNNPVNRPMNRFRFKELASKLKITEDEFRSIEFWKNYNDQNKEIAKRLLEDDFKTYRKNKSQFKEDINQ